MQGVQKRRTKSIKSFLFQVDSFLIDEASQEASLTGSEAEPEFLLSSVSCEAHPSSPETEEATVTPSTVDQAQVDQETQARLEALLEAAGISR